MCFTVVGVLARSMSSGEDDEQLLLKKRDPDWIKVHIIILCMCTCSETAIANI